jgi:hypothetical protein
MMIKDILNCSPPIPFVYRLAKMTSTALGPFEKDIPTIEEWLPAVLVTKAGGFASARQTRYTYVNRETTDDD